MSESTYKRFSEEQIASVADISITDFMRNRGYELTKMSRSEYKIEGYGGLVLSEAENNWYCFTAQKGGGLAQLLMFVESKTWKEAMTEILSEPAETVARYDSAKSEKDKTPFALPARNAHARNVIAYLCGTRKLDYDLVISCLKNKSLYQDKRGNCVFVGYDGNGKAAHAHLKGTNRERPFMNDVAGSDKHFAFGVFGSDEAVFVFESPVDALSYITILKTLGMKEIQHTFLSLNGTSDMRLEQYLSDHPNTREIIFCLDNDKAGNEAIERMSEKYREKYILRIDQPHSGKDFNEELIILSSIKQEEVNEAEDEECVLER